MSEAGARAPSRRGGAPLPIDALACGAGFRGDARFAVLDGGAIAFAPPAGIAVEAQIAAEAEGAPAVDPYALGWSEGHAAGEAEARLEAARRIAHEVAAREALALRLTRIDAALEARLRERLRDTVAALCEATLAPLALDAGALAGRVAHAAAMLARGEDARVVRLHPDDAAIVAGHVGGALTIIADAALARGAVRVEGAHGGVEDGPEQWRAAIEAAIMTAGGPGGGAAGA